MFPSPFLAASLACAFVSVAAAQQVRVFGRLAQDAAGFVLEAPPIRLLGAPAASASLLGAVVEVGGTLAAGAPAPAVNVATLAVSPHAFELGGDDRIGRTLRLRFDSPSATSYYLLASLGTGFVPLDGVVPFASGTFLLEPMANVLVHAGPIQQSWEEPFPIPANTALVGLTVWFQAAMLAAAPPFVYANAAAATLRAP